MQAPSKSPVKGSWLIRIQVGEEVIRRHCLELKNADEGTLRNTAVKTAADRATRWILRISSSPDNFCGPILEPINRQSADHQREAPLNSSRGDPCVGGLDRPPRAPAPVNGLDPNSAGALIGVQRRVKDR
jgi:hypothetical protein